MTKETIIEVLHKEYPYLASEYGVKRIGVFGSHAKGLATEASDVDLVVEFTRPIGFKFVEFIEYLEALADDKTSIWAIIDSRMAERRFGKASTKRR